MAEAANDFAHEAGEVMRRTGPTIASLVLEYVHHHNGVVDYDSLTAEVLRQFPDSAWKPSHWSWYRNQIVRGKYRDQFSEEERRNVAMSGARPISTERGGRSAPPRSEVRARKPFRRIYEDKSGEVERDVAIVLARVAHHVHPDVVTRIAAANAAYRAEFEATAPREVTVDDFLYHGSACVFPGIRRFTGRMVPAEKHKYVPGEGAIIDDNVFPRQLWCYLQLGRGYSAPAWKETGMQDFELAHIFSHKPAERALEKRVFEEVDRAPKPYGLFTCAANVALVPKGLVKPTDGLDAVRIAFFKRHIDLYGEGALPGLHGLKDSEIPEWCDDLRDHWLEPILPANWERNTDRLLKYRARRLREIFSKPTERA